ncbi:MAG: hypothetical protein ACRDA3_05230 [Peptostreptococcaceae bacterium]
MNDIYGITELKQYPSYVNKDCNKSIFIMINIELLNDRLDYIYEIVVRARCKKYKVIKTILGRKLLMSISVECKVIYVNEGNVSTLKKIKRVEEVEEFILLSSNKIDSGLKVKELFIGIEDIFIKEYTATNIQVGCLLLTCPYI